MDTSQKAFQGVEKVAFTSQGSTIKGNLFI
jgi:hypothetical protein